MRGTVNTNISSVKIVS